MTTPSRKIRVLSVFGTRPEAIKMAPVIQALEAHEQIESRVCVTAQHRQMLDQVVSLFGLAVDHDLNIMRDAQGLTHITTAVLQGVEKVLQDMRPDVMLVQGDTTTVMAAAMAAFYQRIPVGHVEAGLRTGDIYAPWPEEMNRKIAGCLAALHFAPTEGARQNLLREGYDPGRIVVTGNTVIDTLFSVCDGLLSKAEVQRDMAARFAFLNPEKRLILVTGHRRENHDGGIADVCRALKVLAERGDVEVVYAVHLNPKVQAAAKAVLDGVDGAHLIAPQEYLPFVWLMNRCALIITDSGGVQEEAPSLGKPVLVTRDTTERPEAIERGTVRLVGADPAKIAAEASRLLDDPAAYQQMSRAENPYGDGRAAQRIVTRILQEF